MLVKFTSLMLLIATALLVPLAAAQSGDSLAGSSWQLVSLDGTPAVEGTAVTLAFGDDNTVSGYAGCNNYSGGYEADNTSLTFSMLISTLRACIDDALNQQETAFLAALQSASAYTLAEGQLVITYEDGKTLVFTEAKGLAGSSWQLVSLDGTPAVEGTAVTLAFGDDNTVSGYAGCNNYSGGYEADNTSLTFSMLISTLRACIDDALNQQETAFLAALQSASAYTLAEGQLVITYEDGKTLVFAEAKGLAGSSWQLVSLDGTPAVEGTAVTLAFGDDNTVSGYAGCNNYSGGYEADNTSLTFSMLISTLRACIDDALNQQETAFLAALQSASAYTLAEGQLVITYEDGKTLVFAEAKGLAGSSWQLVSLDGTPAVEGTAVTLAFGDDNTVSGYAGCNNYSGGYEADNTSLTFSMLISTLRACIDDALNQQETAFLAALNGTVSYTISSAELVITSSDGKELRFTPLDPAAAGS